MVPVPLDTVFMNGCEHVTSFPSFKPTGHNIPLAVGINRGSVAVACPPAGLAGQTSSFGSYAEIVLHTLNDNQVN